MEKPDDQKILTIIAAEMSNSTGAAENDSIQANREAALNTYLGDRGKVPEGRSGVVSTDVADAIEWIMPEVMKAFTQNNEVVTFDAVSAEDRRQAEIESRYVYDVIMKDNEGFIALHEFFKDALMQKNGFFKVFYNDTSEVCKESYTGLTDFELEALQMDPSLEIEGLTTEILMTEQGQINSHDVNVVRRNYSGKVDLICVPPEEIRVNRMHNSVSLAKARFLAHTMIKTKSELLEDGFDKEIIDSIPVGDDENSYARNYRWALQGENINAQTNDNTGDDSQTLYDISECYMLLDIDGDGRSEKCKVTVVGTTNPSHILDIEEVDEWPFISATAILMSHKLFGISIYDRLKEIQAQKTSLLRNVLDNIYLQNNQRTLALEGQCNLDDLLISRPGGVIRIKAAGAVSPYVTPPLPADTYKMFDYLDQTRAGRVGVSPEGSVTDSDIGESVGSEGVERLMNQKEELVGLMIRVFAETGIKPLCEMIRRLLMKHVDTTSDYEYHDEWVQISPKTWKTRNKTTVRVGTGSGNRKQQAAAVGQVLAYQEKILMQPGQSLVTEKQVFAALNDFTKLAGMPGAGAYFLDPDSPEGKANKQSVDQSQQQQQQKELEDKQLLAQVQMKIANAEESKAQTAKENVILTSKLKETEQQLSAAKASGEQQIKVLQQQLAEAKTLNDSNHKDEELQFRYYDADQRADIERLRIEEASKNKAKSDGQ